MNTKRFPYVLQAARRASIVFCLALASAGFTSPPKDGHALALTPRTTLHVIAFGSSSTQGVGASTPSAAYPAQLQAVLQRMVPKGEQVEVLNRGIGGEDVDDMMERLQSDVIARKPDLVIWQTGSNDPLRHVPIARFETETRQGIATMRKAGLLVILMEPQWCPRLTASGHVDEYRDVIRRIGGEMGIPVIRRADLMHKWIADGRMTTAQMLAADGLHMADTGYAQLARDIAPLVLQVSAMDAPTAMVLKAK